MNIKKHIEALQRPDNDTFREMKKIPVKVVLENIRSRSNIGSVFRSCDAFAIDEVILCGYTATPPHRDIQKTALGATETVKWRYFSDTPTALAMLRSENYSIWSVEQTSDSINLDRFPFEKHAPIALVFGNEVLGVEQETIDLSDGSIEIAQHGTKHSLNVAVCAGIVLYEAKSFLKS